MSFPISLDQEQYEALVEFARQGTLVGASEVAADKARKLERFLRDLEQKNGITRYSVWVQWQELDAPLPAYAAFPTKWPPEWRERIMLVGRPIARVDVEQVLRHKARNPTNVLVTRDPGAELGWTRLEDFFK